MNNSLDTDGGAEEDDILNEGIYNYNIKKLNF